MDHHPIPRQITTFEFKLIGFLTLKQFGYLALPSIIGFIFFMTIPSDFYINVVVAVLTVLIGAAFAFLKINERSLDVWISNFVRKIIAPSQFFYHKNNAAPDFLKDALKYNSSAYITNTHIDAQNKLAAYVGSSSKNNQNKKIDKLNEQINTTEPTTTKNAQNNKIEPKKEDAGVSADQPFFFGVVKNKKDTPIPDSIIYLKDDADKVVRILKTNHLGVFATYHPLSPGNYKVDAKDLQNKYFFDTMSVDLQGPIKQAFNIYSKEMV